MTRRAAVRRGRRQRQGSSGRRYTDRLERAGLAPSMGSTGDSCDNALAETINGLYKTELSDPGRPWHHAAGVELAALEWIDWFNHRRPFESIGDIAPVEAEANYHAANPTPATPPEHNELTLYGTRGVQNIRRWLYWLRPISPLKPAADARRHCRYHPKPE